MLKRWLIIAATLLLVCLQANCQPHKAEQGQDSQYPAFPVAPTPVQQSNSPSIQAKPEQHIQADVWVIKSPQKDGYDIAAFWISFALAVIGIAGVFVGIGTLLFLRSQTAQIRRQADQMEAQLSEMRAGTEIAKESAQAARVNAKASSLSAIAAEKSADAALTQIRAMKDRERARLIVRTIEKPEIGAPERLLEGSRPLWVSCFVENAGHGRAFNIRAFGTVSIISDPDQATHEDGFFQQFPQIVEEGDTKYRLNLAGLGREVEDYSSTADFTVISEEIAQQLREGKMFVQASGLLTYEDIFGDSHTTPFRLVWKSIGDDDGGTWRTRSIWIDYSVRST